MNLFVFAHLNEAQTFINRLNLENENIFLKNVFSKNDNLLIVTGEGIYNVLMKLTALLVLKMDLITHIINFGIAGRLDPDLNINACYEISTVVRNNKKYVLNSQISGISCITTDHYISSEAEAEKYFNKGQVVDMELWGIVQAAGFFNIPVHAVKLISDDTRKAMPLKDIKKNAKFYSDQLFDYFNRHFK